MSDIVERLRNAQNWTREESGAWGFTTHVCDRAPFEAAAEIEKLRAAICEWAASIYGYEGVLFLEGLQHEKFINSILDAERDRVEGEQKE